VSGKNETTGQADERFSGEERKMVRQMYDFLSGIALFLLTRAFQSFSKVVKQSFLLVMFRIDMRG